MATCKISLNVRHRVVSQAYIAEGTRLNSFRNDDPDSLIPMSYNGPVQSWLEITQLAHGGSRAHDEQADLFEQE